MTHKRFINSSPFTHIAMVIIMVMMASLIGCTREQQVKEEIKDGEPRAIFSFVEGAVESKGIQFEQLRSDGTINTTALDNVKKIRIIAPDVGLNQLLDTTDDQNPTYIYKELDDSGPSGTPVTFYFIANEVGDEGYDASGLDTDQLDQLVANTQPFFTVGTPAEHNIMVSKYSVKKINGKYQYKCEYPVAEPNYHDVELKFYGTVQAYGIPILLYPIYSRFTVKFQWPEKPLPSDFNEANYGQEIFFDFKDFPDQIKLFGSTDEAPEANMLSHTHSIDLKAKFLTDESFSLYFPATSTSTEKVYLRYKFKDKEHTILVKPKAPNVKYELNTEYQLPIRVFVNPKYDVWVQDIESVLKGSNESLMYGNAGTFIIYKEDGTKKEEGETNFLGKEGFVRINVPFKYSTIVKVKSRLAPAEVKIDSETEGVYWIRYVRELEPAKIIYEDDVPYYYHTFVFSYDVDHPDQKKPLVSLFDIVNSADTDKKCKMDVAFNVLARYAKVNLGDLNTFANGQTDYTNFDPVNDPKLPGKVYQFGRNIPFECKEGNENTEYVSVRINDPKIWEGENGIHMKYMEQIEYPTVAPTFSAIFTWFRLPDDSIITEPVDGYRSWTEMIQTQKGYGAPDSYIGNNGGDPCPPGYRLPTLYDVNSIYQNVIKDEWYEWGSGFANFRGKEIYVSSKAYNTIPERDVIEQGINPSGDPAHADPTKKWKADYVRNDTNENIRYALRYKGTPFYSAFRYEKVGDEGVKISCIALRNTTTTIDDIKDESFWNNPDYKRFTETAFFPTTYTSYADDIIMANNGAPDLWTATVLSHSGMLNIDLAFSTPEDKRYSGGSQGLLPIRCVRD